MPNWKQLVRVRLALLHLPPERELEIVEELALHLETAYETALAKGLGEETAKAQALAQITDWPLLESELARAEAPLRKLQWAQTAEPWIERKGGMRMETLWQDLRYGARMLLKQPGFTLIVVLTLALGIGANTAIFSLVNGILLRSLPFKDPAQLVFLSERSQRVPVMAVSFPNFLDWRAQNQVFEQMAAFLDQTFTLTGVEESERLVGRMVTADYFALLGVQPSLGRTFTPEEDKPGGARVVILSAGFWQRHFAGDPNVLGRTLTLNNDLYTVIGVMPKECVIPAQPTELWTSLGLVSNRLMFRGFHYGTRVYARRKPGITLAQARAEMDAIAKRLQEKYPETNKGKDIPVEDLTAWLARETKPTLFLLWGAVGFVLLIACVNAASLLLARAAGRQREMAVRMALGARPGRIIRQLLTESVLLAFCACVVGLLLGFWGMQGLKALLPETTPRLAEVQMDGWVLAFSVSVALLTGLLFGLAPALQAARTELNRTLKDGARSGLGGRSRLRGALVVAEVALSLVLLIGAGLIMKSFLRAQQAEVGFDPAPLLSFRLALPEPAYAEPQKRSAFLQQLTERLKTLPGVEAAAVTTLLPLGSGPSTTTFAVADQPPSAPDQRPVTDLVFVSPDYFRALRLPLLRGRYLTEQDRADTTPVAVVDETVAQTYWPGQDPIGKRIELNWPNFRESRFTIVGVVRHVKNYGVDQPSRFETYVPYLQDPRSPAFTLVLRTSVEPTSLTAAVRANVRELDRSLPIYEVRTMEEYVARQFGQRRLSMLLMSLFAGVAVVLAAIGIYGLLSYSVTRRTHELGLRLALGAGRNDVLKLVIGQGMKLALSGVALGVAAAFALTRSIASLLFDVSPTDPLTFVVIPLLLIAVALLACYLPARRATKVDPLVALRSE
jgi:putative ABC transport system permease protein